MKKIVTYILITIVSIEVSLQILAFALQSYASYSQRSAMADKGTHKILCIGESTTAMGGESAYPALLEIKLNRIAGDGSFQVINAGISGITTKVILSKLPDWIAEYQPDVAVVMTGINDYWSLPDNGQNSWEKSLEWLSQYSRTAKMIRILHINSKFNEIEKIKSFGSCGMPDASVYAIPSSFNDYLSQASAMEKSQGAKKAISFLEEKVKELEKNGYCTDTYPLLEQIVKYQQYFLKDSKLALATVEQILKHDIVPANRAPFITLKSELRQWLKLPPDDHIYPTALSYWENSYYKINIQKILGEFQSRNIPVIVMQYPRLSIEPLKKNIVTHSGLWFLENKKNFDDVLKEKKWDEIFEDSFGVVFGHTTPLGASVLADNVAAKVLELIPVTK